MTNFEIDTEYNIRMLESNESKDEILNKHVHVYNASCSCPGNNIKIDITGEIISCDINEDGEYFYVVRSDEDKANHQIATRSNFIRFKVID